MKRTTLSDGRKILNRKAVATEPVAPYPVLNSINEHPLMQAEEIPPEEEDEEEGEDEDDMEDFEDEDEDDWDEDDEESEDDDDDEDD